MTSPLLLSKFGIDVEGKRKACLGNGTYVNPIVTGDHPDPTILKDGSDYYLTFSSFEYYPGIVIWHSTDLVNWSPIATALHEPIGTVWALDLIKHAGRYYIYIPALGPKGTRTYVIYAENIRGPWSAPIDLGVSGCIDPGHAVGEDGKRYLFFNGIRRIALSDDGLSTEGELEVVCEPWEYPKDWVVEMTAPEGPKVLRRGEWFYLISAVGGTSGPPTSHMVTVARSRSIHGPWEHCPHNPIVRTASAEEPFWSRGHASIVEGPAGDYWLVYHGYENGYRNLGRQTLLEPMDWTTDGWPRALGGTLDAPMRKPDAKEPSEAGPRLSDDFSTDRLGLNWSLFAPQALDLQKLRYDDGALILSGKGETLANGSVLCCIPGDRRYEASVELEVTGDAHGGLALFYDARGHVGIGFGNDQLYTYNYGREHAWMRARAAGKKIRVSVTNLDHIVTFSYSLDGKEWQQHPWQMEVSGLHHNVFGGFLSLRIALFAAGCGEVRFRNFTYRGLPPG